MNMKKVLGIFVGTVIVASTLITGCGDSSKSASSTYDLATESAEAPEADMAEAALYETSAMGDNATQVNEGAVQTSRKLITTMNLSAETEDFDKSRALVESKVVELGGYIENSSVRNNSKNASYTIRIPKDKLNSFIETIEGNNNILTKSVSVEDVTLSYADTESRKKALRTEEERLLKILENAETVEDLMTVENRLSEVRYQIESIESQLRTYDNKVDYSTVYLDIREVEKYTPVEEQTPGQRMASGFVESVESVRDGIVELFVFIVIHIPQIIILALIVLIIVLIVKRGNKISQKKMAASGYNATAPVDTQSTEGKNE
jgi:hypothetical protein